MEIALIKNSWNSASNSLNNHWAINEYTETLKDSIFEADGIIYSPVDDVNRPYPIFTLDFTLTYQDGAFKMKINLPNISNSKKFFFKEEEGNESNYYVELHDLAKKTNDVTSLLNIVYEIFFPSNKDGTNKMIETVKYWVNEISNIYK